MESYILKTKFGDSLQVEEGHTFEEYRKLFGGAYDEGELWDFSEEDIKDGSIESQPNMVYWLIKDNDGESRFFETTIFEGKISRGYI